jgi:hypothetical protein
MDVTTRKRIANEILNQLGGRRFTMMTGAKNYTAHSDGSLSFRISGNMTRDRVNWVLITLNDSDTYDLKFQRVRGGRNPSITTVHEREGVYCDMLQGVFREVTGLETRMPTIRSA